MQERVQKIISGAGYCSRRDAEDLIKTGHVMVNGKTISIGASADKEKDTVTIDGKRLLAEQKRYLLLNKSKGYVCSRDDPTIKKTVYDLINIKERVYTVGRLDVMTEGLIILTNDGDFANRIMHPRYEVSKTYQVRLDKPFDMAHKHVITRGIILMDPTGRKFRSGQAKISVDPKDAMNVYITLHEGRNRIVRRIFEAIGYKIRQLVRVRIGSIKIAGLERGKWRELTEDEKEGLMKGKEA